MALLLTAACGAFLPGCPTNKDTFRITGPTGLTVATFDYMGNVQTSGPIATGVAAGSPNLSENADKNEFLVKNPGGTVVARVDGATGNLYLKGQLVHDADLALTPDPEFAVCDANGTPQVIIDTQGNLKCRGRIGMVMTRSTASGYTPCEALDVTVRLEYYDGPDVTVVGIQEQLPDDWSYAGWVSGPGTGAPSIAPSLGANVLEFMWISEPEFPLTFTYRVRASQGSSGPMAFGGRAGYRTVGPQLFSNTCLTPIQQAGTLEGECEGEGEGGREGEGEGGSRESGRGDPPTGSENAEGEETGGGSRIQADPCTDTRPACERHSGDQDGDWEVSLSELLRIIQFFNSAGFHCQSGTEDGYAPGPGDQSCEFHDSDYDAQNSSQDWFVNLWELQRFIQFFLDEGYHVESGTEDSFAPALPTGFDTFLSIGLSENAGGDIEAAVEFLDPGADAPPACVRLLQTLPTGTSYALDSFDWSGTNGEPDDTYNSQTQALEFRWEGQPAENFDFNGELVYSLGTNSGGWDTDTLSSQVFYRGNTCAVSSSPVLSVWFPDGALRACITDALGIDRAPAPAELTSVTAVYAANRSIEELDGIEFCTALRRLYLRENLIQDLSPLDGLSNLRVLDLGGNQIKDNLGTCAWENLTSLRTLRLHANELSTNTQDGISALECLGLGASCTGNSKILRLDLHGNGLSGNGLLEDLQDLTSIKELNLHDNDLTDLTGLESLPNLQLLWLSENENLANLTPLVNNAGLGAGDRLSLRNSKDASTAQIDTLKNRGVAVWEPSANPVKSALKAEAYQDEYMAEVALSRDGDTASLDRIRLYEGPYPVPEENPEAGGLLEVEDENGWTVEAPVAFSGVDEVDGIDPATGEMTEGGEVPWSVDDLSVLLPVSGIIVYVAYTDVETETTTVLLNDQVGTKSTGQVKATKNPAWEAIPIYSTLIWGDADLPDERASVVVCVSDAYVAAKLGAPQNNIVYDAGFDPAASHNADYFSDDARKCMGYFIGTEPMRSYRDHIKIYRMDFASLDKEHSEENEAFKDTAFGPDPVSAVVAPGEDRIKARVNQTVSRYVRPGACKACLLRSNRAGNAASNIRVGMFHGGAPDVGSHELGHAYGTLKDEYQVVHDGNCSPGGLGDKRNAANVVCVRRGNPEQNYIPTIDEIPWRHWLVGHYSDPNELLGKPYLASYLGENAPCDHDCTTYCAYCEPYEGKPCGTPPTGGNTVPIPTRSTIAYGSTDCGGGNILWPEPNNTTLDKRPWLGLYEGAYYRQRGKYRSELRCRMRSSNDVVGGGNTRHFCKVCREQLVLKTMQFAGPVRKFSYQKDGAQETFEHTEFTLAPGEEVTFRVCPLLPHHMDTASDINVNVEWRIDNEYETDTTFDANQANPVDAYVYEFPQGASSVEITAKVTDHTGTDPWDRYSRTIVHPDHPKLDNPMLDNPMVETITWTITASP